MATSDAGKEIAQGIKGELKKVSDGIVGPMKGFFPALVSGLPGADTTVKAFKSLSTSNAKQAKETTDAVEKQANVIQDQSESLYNIEDISTNMDENLTRIAQGITGQSSKLDETAKVLQAMRADNADDSLSAGEVEKAREAQRAAQEQTTLLGKIAESINGLSEGLDNLTAEDVGMGLLAPIGIIGAVVSGFVSGFVGEIKRQFDALKTVFGRLPNLLTSIKNGFGRSLTFLDDVVNFLVKDTFLEGSSTRIKNFFSTKLTNIMTRIGNMFDSIMDIANKGLEPITQTATRVKNFFTTRFTMMFTSMANTIDTIIDAVTNSPVGQTVTRIKNFFTTGFNTSMGNLANTIDTVTDAVTNSPVGQTIARIKNFFTTGFNTSVGSIANTFDDVVRAADDFVVGATAEGSFFSKIKGIFTSIKDYFGRFGPIFDDFINAVRTSITFADEAGGIVGRIVGFAKGFGQLLGKIFLPITILMSAFDFITGFMEGYSEEGIIGGMREGLAKLFANLVGAPLDLLTGAVGWVLGMFGFDKAQELLASFSFTELIGDLVRLPFNMISGAVDWVKTLFTDPAQALTDLWNGIVGPGGLIGLLFSPISTVIDWIGGLFDIDIGQVIKDFIPNWVLKWLPDSLFGDEPPDEEPPEGSRAVGGPIKAGESYLVGENGPEMFTSGVSGQITNNNRLIDGIARQTANMVAMADAERSELDSMIRRQVTNQAPVVVNNSPTTISNNTAPTQYIPVSLTDGSASFMTRNDSYI